MSSWPTIANSPATSMPLVRSGRRAWCRGVVWSVRGCEGEEGGRARVVELGDDDGVAGREGLVEREAWDVAGQPLLGVGAVRVEEVELGSGALAVVGNDPSVAERDR